MSQEFVPPLPDVQNVVSSQAWLLHQIDDRYASYLEMNESSFAASPFLDQRVVPAPQARQYKVDVAEVLASSRWRTASPRYPTRYILHISHVGSTLVSRALGVAPTCLALREPLPLRHLTQRYLELQEPDSWLSADAFMQLADFTMRSLGRPLGRHEDVVIKCTSWVNALAPLFLSPQFGGRHRVVAVYSSLDNFVANTLKSVGGRRDVESQAQSRVRRLSALLPTQFRLYELDTGEIAAMSWLCEMLSIQRACAEQGVDLRWLDFDQYLQDPLSETAALAQHLALPWMEETAAALAESGILTRYAKRQQDIPFSRSSRDDLLQQFKRDHPGLVASANRWIDRQFAQHPELFAALGSFR